jgi:nitrogen regulatory protein PII
MKLIVAMIPAERLDAVQAAIEQTDATFASVGQAIDLRDQSLEVYRGQEYQAARIKMRLEVLVVNDGLVEETIGVVAAACSGDSKPYGRGCIFVLPVEDLMPICGYPPRFAHTITANR